MTRDTLHFATIVTPDADPVARQGMLDVLHQFFADKNAGYRGESRPMRSTRGVMYRVHRKWQLHVWELTGPPESWERQLAQHLLETPVFAVISGIGGRTWAPVHRFCERVPCPASSPTSTCRSSPSRTSIRSTSRAACSWRRSSWLAGAPRPPRLPRGRVVQVFRTGDVGEEAARALAASKAAARLESLQRPLGADAKGRSSRPRSATRAPDDTLVLWLAPGDLALLPSRLRRVAAVLYRG